MGLELFILFSIVAENYKQVSTGILNDRVSRKNQKLDKFSLTEPNQWHIIFPFLCFTYYTSISNEQLAADNQDYEFDGIVDEVPTGEEIGLLEMRKNVGNDCERCETKALAEYDWIMAPG